MRRYALAICGVLLLSGSAHAYTINILPDPGNLIAFQDDCNGGSCAGESGSITVSGLGTFTGDVTGYAGGESILDIARAPLPTNAYLAVGNATGQGGGSATLSTVDGPYKAFDIEWGSIDTYNSLVFETLHHGDITITGSQIMALLPGGVFGSTSAFVQILGLPSYEDVRFNSTGLNAFEFQMSGTPCPEMSTWAMMLVGFGGLGYAAFNRRRVAVSIV